VESAVLRDMMKETPCIFHTITMTVLVKINITFVRKAFSNRRVYIRRINLMNLLVTSKLLYQFISYFKKSWNLYSFVFGSCNFCVFIPRYCVYLMTSSGFNVKQLLL